MLKCSQPNVYFKIEKDQEFEFNFNQTINITGGLTHENVTAAIPIQINIDEISATINSNFSDNGYIIAKSDVETIFNSVDFNSLSGYIRLDDTVSLLFFEISLAGELGSVQTFDIRFLKEELGLSDLFAFTLREPVIEYSFENILKPLEDSFSDSLVHIAVEGLLIVASQDMMQVRLYVPQDSNDTILLEMVQDELVIPTFTDVALLLGGDNFAGYLPDVLSSQNNIVLNRFAVSFGPLFSGFNFCELGFGFSDDISWEVIPGVVTLKNPNVLFSIPELVFNLTGIVQVGQTEFTGNIIYNLEDNLTKLGIYFYQSDNETNTGVSLDDLIQIKCDVPTLLPGISDVEVILNGLSLEVSRSDTIYIDHTHIELFLEHSWNIFSLLSIENIHLTMNISRSDGELDSDEYITYGHITGDCSLGNGDPFPVALFVPDSGDWSLQIAHDEYESYVRLPGLSDIMSLTGIEVADHIPNILTFDELKLEDFILTFPHPSEGILRSLFFEISMDSIWDFDGVFSLNDIKFSMGFDYTKEPVDTSGAIRATFTLGDLILPVLMPLPFNEHEWTLQLDSPAQLPSLSYFSGLAGFDANNLLAELTGFSGIPEIMISRFDIKFDTDPYKTRKLAIAADFSSSVSITLPPGLEVRLDSLLFEMDDESGELALQNFTAYGAVVETIGKTTTLPVQLTRTPATWEMAINTEEGEAISIDGKFFDSITPGLPLPSSLDDTGFDITGIHMVATHDMELVEFSVYTTITSPNAIFGLDIFIDEIPIRIIYDNSEAEGRWGIQVLEWPFNTGGFKYLQREGWILLDLGDFGSVQLELPTFYPQSDNFVVSGAVKVTHDGENIIFQNGSTQNGIAPNIPLKALIDKIGLYFLNSFFPDRVPLTPGADLKNLIENLGGHTDKLPESFQDYLDIRVPDSAEFEVVISSTGDISVTFREFKVFTDGEYKTGPVKMLFPTPVFTGGIKVYSAGFRYIKGVPFFTLDAEMDLFVTAFLVMLTWIGLEQIPLLPPFKKVQTKLSMRDVWFLLAAGFPVPLFYDDLSVDYFGVEGINAGIGIKLPKPVVSVYDLSAIGNIVSQLKRFLTEQDYFLDEDEFTFNDADLKFSLVPFFIELPSYVGDPTIGTKDYVFKDYSISDALCNILNVLKKPSLSLFFAKMIEKKYRYIDQEVIFGPMKLNMAMGFTTPYEFYTENPTGFSNSLMDHLFPDLASQTLITAGDSETELPKPRHYLQCGENTGSVITDRVTGMQLMGDDSKTLNWQKENIKAYQERAYIQSSQDPELTSILTGDLIDSPYDQYTITFLTKLSGAGNGCLLSSSADTSIWIYDGSFESCGGAKAADVSVPENTWVRVTLVQSELQQFIYIDRELAGQKEVEQNLGTGKMILGSLNEEITVDLPESEGTYNGAYTDITIYDQVLTEVHVNKLCDLDDGVIENNVSQKDDSILALLAGSWELAPWVSSHLMLGVSMRDFSAAGLQVALNGTLGDNFLGFDFRGVCQVDVENKDTPFLIDLRGGFYLLGKQVIFCSVVFVQDYFEFTGDLNLFNWPCLTVEGKVGGKLQSNGYLSLTANGYISIGGLDLVQAETEITNNQIFILCSLLGLSFEFKSSISRNNLYLAADIEHRFGIDLAGKTDVTIPTPLGDIQLPSIDDFINVTVILAIKVSRSGLNAKATAEFSLLEKGWSITISLPGIAGSLKDLEDFIEKAIINEIINALYNIPGALATFIEWAKKVWKELVNYTENVAKVLKYGFNKTHKEVASILQGGFEFTGEQIGRGLNVIGATAREAGNILLDLGQTGVEGILILAGYPSDAISDWAKCPLDFIGICVKTPW